MENDIVQRLLVLIPVVENRNYWFVRADGGENYDYFKMNSIIGIGWNAVNLYDLSLPANVVKSKIHRVFFNNNTRYSELQKKRQSSSVYNKLMRFKELKRGDVVVVPGEGSDLLNFGIIADDLPFNGSEESLKEYHNLKRRKVIWKAERWVNRFDPMYSMAKSNMHSLSSVVRYKDYIDAIMDEFFLQGDTLHQVINIRTKDKINFNKLTELLDLHKELLSKINRLYRLDEEYLLEEIFVKLSLNSPGIINVAVPIGSVGILFSFLLTFSSCENTSQFGEYEQIGNEMDTSLKDKFERYKQLKEEFDADNRMNYFSEQ